MDSRRAALARNSLVIIGDGYLPSARSAQLGKVSLIEPSA